VPNRLRRFVKGRTRCPLNDGKYAMRPFLASSSVLRPPAKASIEERGETHGRAGGHGERQKTR